MTSKTDKPALDLNQDMVRQLAEILNETNLSEIEYEVGNNRIRVARQLVTSPVTTVAAPSVLAPVAVPDQGMPQAIVPQDPADHPGAVKSPMVGNAYMSSAPGVAAFVKVGDSVKIGDSILIIEAMKVMNQIKAKKDGVVKEILVQDGDPIEFDEVLMIIE